jgi:anti-sigma regulatory factor (Ser/Thr protein kinase)
VSAQAQDRIQLTLPAEEDFRHIAHLVVGGLGVRLDLTFEDLDDVQVALEALLACRDDEGEIVVTVDAAGRTVRASVGPFPAVALDALERGDSPLGLRRVLETVTDSFEIEERDGGSWVELTKQTSSAAEATA